MKNLHEHFKQIADMQERQEDADRMLSALMVGATAAVERARSFVSTYSDVAHLARVARELDGLPEAPDEPIAAAAPAEAVSESPSETPDYGL